MADIDIDHLCRLARLELDPAERVAAEADLQRIIAMVDEMQAVDTSGVTPLAHPLPGIQRLRADAVTETVDRGRFQALAPAVEDGLYLVPRVVE
ncbi:MAG: Asp-tRNA(Asn)/Glu-tRNA(Gln) amidotransferase subunit GatC [Pseudomonadales bacterium]|jgi:aspartyl-tRNA(Asn)/glutamyl-tRNA(Gln) amidotransferase subunit C